MRIYIAGKVTGEDLGKVFVKFNAPEAAMIKRGHEVVNPMRITSQRWSWERCMKVCIDNLLTCNAIYMLNDWKDSRGAKIEHELAKIYGLKIMYQK
jgi:hypothetical protein